MQEGIADLVARAYPELRRMACVRARARGLGVSSLAQETACRILRLPHPPQEDGHLRGVAWQLMGWILSDRIRTGQQRQARELSVAARSDEAHDTCRDAEHISHALDALRRLAPRKAEALILTTLAGMTAQRAAALLGVSEKTIGRDVAFARAWLASQLSGPDGHPAAERGGCHATVGV